MAKIIEGRRGYGWWGFSILLGNMMPYWNQLITSLSSDKICYQVIENFSTVSQMKNYDDIDCLPKQTRFYNEFAQIYYTEQYNNKLE